MTSHTLLDQIAERIFKLRRETEDMIERMKEEQRALKTVEEKIKELAWTLPREDR